MVNAVIGALISCTLTYLLTGVGALGVFIFDTHQQSAMASNVIAVAAGLMMAAVYELYDECMVVSVSSAPHKVYTWVPVFVGTVIAVLFLTTIDAFFQYCQRRSRTTELPHTRLTPVGGSLELEEEEVAEESVDGVASAAHVRQAWLMFLALTVQHIPEALAMGVSFGEAIMSDDWAGAISLSIAIGLQDIPEGMAAAVVLRRVGFSKKRSFLLGQATGLVQPLSGVIGAVSVIAVKALLPYALAFAGGCMMLVTIRDMVPDSMATPASGLLFMIGFIVMTTASMVVNELVGG